MNLRRTLHRALNQFGVHRGSARQERRGSLILSPERGCPKDQPQGRLTDQRLANPGHPAAGPLDTVALLC